MTIYRHCSAVALSLLLVAVLLQSCGYEDQRNIEHAREQLGLDRFEALPGTGYVNPAFRRYVSRFENESGKHIMDRVIIDFGDTDDDEAANCQPSKLSNVGVPEITVSRSYWSRYTSDSEREVIIFHELGHCVLGRAHTSTWGGLISFSLSSQTCAPLSLMYPEADWVLLNTYETHRDYYVKELVGKPFDRGEYDIVSRSCDYWHP